MGEPVWQRFVGSDRRTLVGVKQTVEEVLREPCQIAWLVDGMRHPDAAVSGACADAAEKISSTHPELFAPFKKALFKLATSSTSPSVRWHLAQILPRITLTAPERAAASEILLEYVDDPSALVKTFAMQGLADLAMKDSRLAKTVVPLIAHLTENGTAAMRARGRKLLKLLRGQSNSRKSEIQ